LFVLITLITCVTSGFALAAEPLDAEGAAQELADLGLLRGTGAGFALEAPCDRLQGAALFTRLLGQEEAATASLRPHPFLDIRADNWAAPYVAYLYNRGFAYGTASNRYGAGPMSPHQFATFCLRALDYTEGSALSDFQWSDALDFMVRHSIISGSLRNSLAADLVFRRGDAVLLAHAALSAELKEGGQTLLQRLLEQGVVTAEQAAAFGGWPAALRIAYPEGLLDQSLLALVAAEQGLTVSPQPYAVSPPSEEEIYRQLREPGRSFDICVLPGYLVANLREEGLLEPLKLRDFGGEEAFIPPVRDNPYWYDKERRLHYALPLAFEALLLYYDSARVQNPDWGWLFRASYSGGVYMPADPAMLIPLALHYYNLPYDTADDKKLLPAIKLLSEQAAAVPAYMDQHMLDIAEKPGAVFGVISSRSLPQLNRRQQENPAYANWRAVLPPAGGSLRVYYAVITKNGAKKEAAAFLQALTSPEAAASHAQLGGYLPALRGVGSFLSGAIAAAYPLGSGERCRPLHLDQQSRLFYEQTLRNVLLDEAQNTAQPAIACLEFSFMRQGAVYRNCTVDLANKEATASWAGAGEKELLQTQKLKLREDQVKACTKELARLGVALWKEYYDGPPNGPAWSLRITFANGSEKNCQGNGLPPAWAEVAGALLMLTGTDIVPDTL
jgi:spermidine/putrescine-binding protein